MIAFKEETFTYHDSKKMFFLSAGPSDGPLLVFCHGWPAIGKTWKSQLETFASLGFLAVAPDLPGYGNSTVTKNAADYSLESVNQAMLALLDHVGRESAVWIGHDYGAPAVWSFAAHFPERTVAAAGLAVPYGVVELGLEAELKTVNRKTYPEDQYPYGPWSYQRFYETSFEKVTAFFDSDPAACLRKIYRNGSPNNLGKPAETSNVMKDGGWFGGPDKPDPAWKLLPSEDICIDEGMYDEVVAAMAKTGFWGADAWYSNHERNRAYSLQKWKKDGYLQMPVLFIGGKFDRVCDTFDSSLADAQKRLCPDLTEVMLDAGHWVAQEQPFKVNAAISKWLVERVKNHWP